MKITKNIASYPQRTSYIQEKIYISHKYVQASNLCKNSKTVSQQHENQKTLHIFIKQIDKIWYSTV